MRLQGSCLLLLSFAAGGEAGGASATLLVGKEPLYVQGDHPEMLRHGGLCGLAVVIMDGVQDAKMLADLLVLLVVALGAALLLFTFLPPAGLLFTDLSGARTWSSYPY